MANSNRGMCLLLACFLTLHLHGPGINGKPVKRSIDSGIGCIGVDCYIAQDQLDFQGNPRDTELLENITSSLAQALPEMTALLKNVASVHRNATATALPAIVNTLEDDKELQEAQNVLIENGTAATTPLLSEMAASLKTQQATQDAHNQRVQEQTEAQRLLLENVTVSLYRATNLLKDQAERQDRILESMAEVVPLLTGMLNLQQSFQPVMELLYSSFR